MKKLLILFVALDLIFVGLILKVITSAPSRTISSVDDRTYKDLTEGQKNKWDLVKTLNFEVLTDSVVLTTDKLQMICDTSTLIELRFTAQNVAFAGSAPTVLHTYSCESIRKDQTLSSLQTAFADFRNLHQSKKVERNSSQLAGLNIFADEEFPTNWRLTAVHIMGPNTFTINEHEIHTVLTTSFDFAIPTSVK